MAISNANQFKFLYYTTRVKDFYTGLGLEKSQCEPGIKKNAAYYRHLLNYFNVFNSEKFRSEVATVYFLNDVEADAVGYLNSGDRFDALDSEEYRSKFVAEYDSYFLLHPAGLGNEEIIHHMHRVRDYVRDYSGALNSEKLFRDELKTALADGFPIDFTDDNGWTLLHWAAHYTAPIQLHYLIDADASIDVRNNDGFTPFSIACLDYVSYGNANPENLDLLVIRDLILSGADEKLDERWMKFECFDPKAQERCVRLKEFIKKYAANKKNIDNEIELDYNSFKR